MKCPTPKCKKNLLTKRTLANGKECRRERFCPKCKKTLWTIELFQDDFIKTNRELLIRLSDERYKRNCLKDKYNTIRNTINMIIKSPAEE